MATAFPKDRTDNWEHIGGAASRSAGGPGTPSRGTTARNGEDVGNQEEQTESHGGEVHSPGPPSVSARGHFRQRCHCLVKWAISSESELLTRG